MSIRAWIDDMYLSNGGGIRPEFFKGVDEFVEFATSQPDFMDGDKIKCPCTKCRNCKFWRSDEVKEHLYRRGFTPHYYWWTAQGEHDESFIPSTNNEEISRSNPRDLFGHLNAEQRMIFDIAGPSFVPPTQLNSEEDRGMEHFDQVNDEVNEMVTDPVPNEDEPKSSQRFLEVLRAADEPLYPGCETHTQLSFVARLMTLKSEYNVPASLFNGFLQLYDEILPQDHKVPKNLYQTKKLVRDLGLPVEKIDMCPQGCMLYWKDDVNAESCKFCAHARYKDSSGEKHTPHKVLHYLPLIPRLQRLYASEATASHMTWHSTHKLEEGMMSHPSDGKAWKRLDERYPDFASETRNIRLGLCSDGFAPFGKSGKQYSCWPVIITPYNLPPEMCMKTQYMFLSMIVPGPKNPKKLIDVCLQPLIDELIQLWQFGVTTYDVSRKEYFIMRAALLWTINDFPAYAMMSGWSTAGVLACPSCMERTKAFRLQHGRKACWFDCHRQFTKVNHPFRKNKKEFYKDRVETSLPPPMLTGEQIWDRVREYPTAIDEPHNNPPGYGTEHKWTKQSIFWRLSYWKDLLVRHNLDVMHIEKNVFDNVFNTLMDIPGKTKDNLNARKDLKLYCCRPELHVDDDYSGTKPKAIYTLTRDEKRKICEWVKSLKFPDGYASNIGRCVQIDDCKLIGMKSHDCHVFMQRLLPIAFKELLPSSVWGPLTELSCFFRSICSSALSVDHMVQLKTTVPLLLCKLERIFPPSFFDSMEHVVLHLADEAEVCGPVQYRWMYPFERYLYHLKEKLSNPTHVEASIIAAYLSEEASNFAEHYFQPHVPSKLRRPSRNNDVFEEDDHAISCFNYPGRSSGKEKKRWMTTEKEWHAAHTYVLHNCREVDEFVEKFAIEKGGADDDKIDKEFAGWFKNHVMNNKSTNTNDFLCNLAWGPTVEAKSWPVYFVNGHIFHTMKHGVGKKTMNSGVCVKGCDYENAQSDFYGFLEEIIELDYSDSPDHPMKIVLFKCDWFNPTTGMRVHPDYHIVEINHKKKYKKYDPFIFSQQAVQVYYAEYPGARRDRMDWMAVCKVVPRGRIEERWTSSIASAYQSTEGATSDSYVQINVEDVSIDLRDPVGSYDFINEDEMAETSENDNEDDDLFNSVEATGLEDYASEGNHDDDEDIV